MEIPPSSRHHSQGLRSAPFILEIKPKPVLPGELIEHVERDGIMPVIEAIGQPIRSPEFHGMLAVEIVNILLKDLIDIPVPIAKYHVRREAQIHELLTVLAPSDPVTSKKKIRPFVLHIGVAVGDRGFFMHHVENLAVEA